MYLIFTSAATSKASIPLKLNTNARLSVITFTTCSQEKHLVPGLDGMYEEPDHAQEIRESELWRYFVASIATAEII